MHDGRRHLARALTEIRLSWSLDTDRDQADVSEGIRNGERARYTDLITQALDSLEAIEVHAECALERERAVRP